MPDKGGPDEAPLDRSADASFARNFRAESAPDDLDPSFGKGGQHVFGDDGYFDFPDVKILQLSTATSSSLITTCYGASARMPNE
jgi:hypothetical protein